jgi:hypothetical protein
MDISFEVFSRQSSLSGFFKLSSRTRASPPVLLDIEHDDPYGPPAVLKDMPPPQLLFVTIHTFLNCV